MFDVLTRIRNAMLEYADIPRNCSSLFFRARSAEPRDRRNMNRSRTFGMLGRKFVFTPALILFPFAWVYASAQISEPAHRSNIDKTSLETYLRHLQLIAFCGFGSRRSRPRRISKELASGHFHSSLPSSFTRCQFH